MFVNVFNFSNSLQPEFPLIDSVIVFLQQTVVYFAFILLILFLLTVLLTNLNTTGQNFTVTFNVINYMNSLLLGFILVMVFVSFSVFLWNYNSQSLILVNYPFLSLEFGYIFNSPVIDLNNSVLSEVIILLAFSSGLVCIYLLGENNLSGYLSNISIFSIFLVAIIFMVYTTNLLVMFLGFECLFVPTLYFVYSHGYVQSVDKALKILLYWTLFGAFLVLTTLSYVFVNYNTLHYFELLNENFTDYEKIFIYLGLFFGFGVKVPVFPFHYWLTNIHVEAPAGFSIFLSGFLVNAAIYCFYYFNLIFESYFSSQLVSLVAIFGVLESSMKMWTQTDFNNLIAFATIQEMNLILYLLINYQSTLDYSLILFILIHGWLSTLMFFLVDIIQKNTSSSNIVAISGLAYSFPEINLVIWFIIIIFSGFPLTVKFVIEWAILGNLMLQSSQFVIVVFFIIVVFGVLGFANQMIIILYGVPSNPLTINTLISRSDKYLYYLIIFILLALNLINFFLG